MKHAWILAALLMFCGGGCGTSETPPADATQGQSAAQGESATQGESAAQGQSADAPREPDRDPPLDPQAATSQTTDSLDGNSPDSNSPAADTTLAADVSNWQVMFMQGQKIGYQQNRIRRLTQDGKKRVQFDLLSHLFLKRFGQPTDQKIQLQCLETEDGELLQFANEIQMGPSPMTAKGHVQDGQLVVTITTQGHSDKQTLPWPESGRGFYGVEQAMTENPLSPGETRNYQMLYPGLPHVTVVDVKVQAFDYESVRLLDRTVELLRVESSTTIPGAQAITTTAWADRQGEVHKTRIELQGLETYRTTRAEALEEPTGDGFDLGRASIVRVATAIPHAHDTHQVTYRVHLKGKDPASIFPVGASQRVDSIDQETAEITILAVRPDTKVEPSAGAADVPTKEHTAPNSLIQSNDPRVVEMAHEAVGDKTDPWEVAVALEKYVGNTIRDKNFSTGFATAAEVAQTKEGDCTEHAVLLAGLARARGIPSRVAMGLVYAHGLRGFGYHMWTELYIQDRWIPMDATLAQGGIGAAHLKLGDSSLEGSSAMACFLPVFEVMGNLTVEVVNVD
jgi:hypothetical protein